MKLTNPFLALVDRYGFPPVFISYYYNKNRPDKNRPDKKLKFDDINQGIILCARLDLQASEIKLGPKEKEDMRGFHATCVPWGNSLADYLNHEGLTIIDTHEENKITFVCYELRDERKEFEKIINKANLLKDCS